MKRSKKTGVAALVLCGAMALSTIGMGLAKWQTNISADGNVTASGNWNVALTDASVTLSKGTEILENDADYSLQNVCASNYKAQACIEAAVSRSSLSSSSSPKTGTQSRTSAISGWLWLVDTTRFDMSKLGTLTTEQRRLIMLDGLENGYVIRLSDNQTAPDGTKINAMRAWNYYRNKNDYFGDASARDTILNGLVAQSDTLIKTLRPDTFRNYALICIATDGTTNCNHLQFAIGQMGRTDGKEPAAVTYTSTSATFSDISFSLPEAWAEYKLTITNNGTVNANLSGAVIALNTENSDQLTLKAPDLSDETLKPGESCTVTFVVQVPESCTGELNATGSITLTLPYAQDSVEPAPEAGHTHA